MMHYYIQNYLESAAKVCKENGQLVPCRRFGLGPFFGGG